MASNHEMSSLAGAPPLTGTTHTVNSNIIHIPDVTIETSWSGSNETFPQRHDIGTQRSLTEPIDVVIYFSDKSAVNFKVMDGQNATAHDLFELVMEELNLVPAAREIFALWLVSDHLELQLKPNQVPFKLVCMWDDLLKKYTSLSAYEIDRDEPVIMFERNVFYSRVEEMKVEDQECLRLLYNEARENVVDGRYPLTDAMSHTLAGIEALINANGLYNPSTHTPAHYEENLKEYYPPCKLVRKRTFFGNKDMIGQKLADSHKARFNELRCGNTCKAGYRRYLEECWKLPFYGAAYFSGQVEHPSRKSLFGNPDDPVYIAINPEGVFIIDMDDVVFLVGIFYSDLKWRYAVPSEDNRENLPCLFLQFPFKEERETVIKIFQVFSKQASLADTLMQTCKKLFINQADKNAVIKELDMLDGIQDGLVRSEEKVWGQFDRLCLITHRPSDQTLKGNVKGFKSQTIKSSTSRNQPGPKHHTLPK